MSNKQWYVVYTTPKGEKKAEARLQEKGIETFLPLQETVRQWSDRKKKVQSPLFTSYLFVQIDLIHDKYPVLETYGVVRFVNYLGKPAIVREEEIEAIRYLLKNYTELEAESLQPGQRVQVKSGAFEGQQGVIQQMENGYLVLELDSIGQRLKAKIPYGQVKKHGK